MNINTPKTGTPMQQPKPATPKPTTGRVLQDTASADKARIAQLEAQLAKAQAKLASKRQLRCAVSKKGAVSLYGLNARFPVTLYANQWETVFSVADDIRKFIAANADKLSQPGDDTDEAE